ncbi:MAG: hypothetical protein D6750_03680 [Bacteroidetes bacterium]|nr:MAG: hypothetical protein D6750_03680 [Bacteroidota bacterium]
MTMYKWLKRIDYGEYFDGALVYGSEIGEPDAEAKTTHRWGTDELECYNAVLALRDAERPINTYLVSYGDILPVHTREDAVLNELDSDSVWFVEDGQECVFLPNPDGEWAYYLILDEVQ